MLLSVIVPVYNMAADRKLNYCIDSLVAQTVEDMEIIAVDDCSTDNSLEILRDYEKRYPGRVKVIASPVNKRQGGAKNLGLKEAKGEWLGFIDSDDWIVPDYYERLIAKAEETGADLVGCDYCLTEEHSFKEGKHIHNNRQNQVGVLDREKRKSLILDGGSLVVKIYRRDRIIANNLFFPEGIFYEDNAVGNSYLIGAKHFEYIEEPLYFYYQHNTSTVHTITQKRCEDRMEAARVMITVAKDGGYFEEYKDELEYKFTLLHYVNTLFSYMVGVKHTKYGFIKRMGKEIKEYFPDFQENPYYVERTHAEEKKLIAMQQKSTLYFMVYYKLLWAYRNFRKGRK